MKLNNTFPTLLTIFVMVSCSQEKEVDEGKIVFRNDLAYEVNSTKPFTGCELIRYTDGSGKDCYKNGDLSRRETYHRNGQLRSLNTMKTQDNGQVLSTLEKCFYYNGQSCWGDGGFVNRRGEKISQEEFLDWFWGR